VEVPGNGGAAYGGGVDVAGGTASLAESELLSNQANGGWGGSVPATSLNSHRGTGGNGYGGGLYAGGGTSTLTNDTFTNNEAIGGGFSPFPGQGFGGGIDIASAAIVSLDSFTVNNTTNNYIYGFGGMISNINGTYTLL
jgi:hypothetical protein